MIASMLMLDYKAIKSLKILDAYSLHKVVYGLFPGNQRDFLYCELSPSPINRRILIISRTQPQVPQVGRLELKIIPDTFLEHRTYQFSCKVNPTRDESATRKRIPLLERDKIIQWFVQKGISHGFSVPNPSVLDIQNEPSVSFLKGNNRIVLSSTSITGILEVTDQEKFKDSFCKGIGRGKAFGFGLIQLRPIK